MRQDKISSSSFKKPHRHLLDADLRFRTLSYDCVLKRLVRFQKLSPDFWGFCRIKTLLPNFRHDKLDRYWTSDFRGHRPILRTCVGSQTVSFDFEKPYFFKRKLNERVKRKLIKKNQREKMKQGKNRLIDERTSGVNWRPSIDFERFFPI